MDIVNLCTAVTGDLYGPLAASVVKKLSLLGRMTALELARELKLHLSVVLRVLVSLVQTRQILFWSNRENNRTFYSVNLPQIYNNLRAGWIITSLKNNFASYATDSAKAILETLAVESHLKAHRLCEKTQASNEDLVILAQAKIISQVCDFDFWPTPDLQADLQQQELKKLNANASGLTLSESNKKTQVNTASESEYQKIVKQHCIPGGKVHDQTVLGINYETFLAAGRRQALVAFASKRVGATTAAVYEIVLLLSERRLTGLHQARIPSSENNVTTMEISQHAAGMDLVSAFVDGKSLEKQVKDEEGEPLKKQRLGNGSARGIFALSTEELVAKHLLLLEESPFRFIRRVGERGKGEWFVPFDRAVEDMRRVNFDGIVTERFGHTTARLLRAIRDNHKIDEKTLSQITLLQQTEIRHEVTKLQLLGFVDLQEVPRGNDRAAGRNFYFWYHNSRKAYAKLVDEFYKCILDVNSQLRDLKNNHSILLAKLKRKDVQDDMDKYLTSTEKAELKGYEEQKQELISIQMALDEQVRLFNEY